MNIKTERIENHRAQLTVEIETEALEDAKRKAARKISRQVQVRGFRKGKAPYRLVAQTVGEDAILDEALDALGDKLYKQALEESDVAPYGPGVFDDFQLEPAPTFVFTVPLQPEVDLKDYLAVRIDFDEPEVSDHDVDEALKQLQLRAIEVLDEDVEIAAPGHRVTIAVDSEFVDGEPQETPDSGDNEADAEDALTDGIADDDADDEAADLPAPYIPRQGDTFVKDDNATIILDPNEDPFTHGFVGRLIGVERGATVEFELTIPDDDADETIIGRRVKFYVDMNNIESISIPALDDDFARLVCRNRGDLELDMAGLRATTRAELERTALSQAKSEYSGQVLQRMVEGAEIDFPEIMLGERIDDMIEEFERGLSQQRVSMDDYYRLTNRTKDDLREQYRESATESLRHSLVMREIVSAQDIEISDEDIASRLDAVVANYGSSPEIRKLLDTPPMRDNISNDLLMNHANEHLYAIGRGEDPALVIAAMRAQAADDAQRAKERRERLRQHQSADEAAALTAEDQDRSGAEGDPSEGAALSSGSAADELIIDVEQAKEA